MRTPTTLQPSTHAAASRSTLDALADAALDVQVALRQAIEDCPERPGKAGQLAKHLGLDGTSTWRIWQVAYADTERDAILHLGGETALERFLAALVSRGVADRLCENVRHALREFRQLVDQQVGDVNTLKLMVERSGDSAFNGDRYAKSLYDAMRYRYGVYGRSVILMNVRLPSQFDGLVDVVEVRAYQGVRTLQDGTTHMLASRLNFEQRGTPQWHDMAHVYEPLGQPDKQADIPPDAEAYPFLPAVSRMNGRSLWSKSTSREVYISGGRAGAVGESSVVLATRLPAYTPQYHTTPAVGVGMQQHFPFESQVLEFYVNDEQVQAGLVPGARVYDPEYGDRTFPGKFIGEARDAVEHHRPGRPRSTPEEIERYDLMTQEAERTIGRPLSELHLFRWRVKYPVVRINYSLCTDAIALDGGTA